MSCNMRGHEEMTREVRDVEYDWCGLTGVVLGDIVVLTCPNCEEEETEIPGVENLHRSLAKSLLMKSGPLLGEEIRFLRKHVGWSSTAFAKHIGVALETVSRWESGRQKCPSPTTGSSGS